MRYAEVFMNHFALNGVISPQELYYYALRAVAMLIVIPFHESAHALISWKLGDSTAKDMGRLCMIAAGVGWAKPVGINPTRFKNPKRGMAVSAAAGPLSNFLLAYAAMLLYKVVYYACGGAAPQLVLDFLYVLISMNISLGVFNLIPVPPFDGSRIVLLFLPQKLYFQAMRYEKYIMGVVLLLVFFGLLNTPLNLCVNAAWRLLLNLTGFVELLFGIA